MLGKLVFLLIFLFSNGGIFWPSFQILSPQNITNPKSNQTMSIRVGKATLFVEIADTPRKRSIGLMYRDKLPENQGMLFVFPEEDYLSFWMKNTKIPLSLAYFNKEGVLTEIYHMQPNQTKVTYPSQGKAMYALEVNQNWFEKNGVGVGSILVLEQPVFGK